MVSVQFKQEKHNALVSFLMIVIAVLFLLYMGSSLVNSTRTFWENYSIENLLERHSVGREQKVGFYPFFAIFIHIGNK